jgi:hypothetical protein
MKLPDLGILEEVRVCEPCYAKAGKGRLSKYVIARPDLLTSDLPDHLHIGMIPAHLQSPQSAQCAQINLMRICNERSHFP